MCRSIDFEHFKGDIHWVKNDDFTVLSITFNTDLSSMVPKNYDKAMTKLNNLTTIWGKRNLTVLGKITVLKSVIVPYFNYYLHVRPSHADHYIQIIVSRFFKFIWQNKPDRISRQQLIRNYSDGGRGGGLKMIYMSKHIISLKTSGFARLLKNAVNTFSHDYLKKHNIAMANYFTNGDYFFELARQNVNNPFWRDAFNCAKHFFGNHCYSNPENDEAMILSQPIWNNSLILIDNKPVFYHHWVQGGIAFINDLLDEEGKFYTYDYFVNTFNIKANFLEFYGILVAIKKQWKQCLRNLNYRLSNPMNSFMNIIPKSNQLCCKAIYDKLLNSSAICNKSYTKWSRTHDVSKDS